MLEDDLDGLFLALGKKCFYGIAVAL